MAQNYGALIGELVNALQSSLSAYAPARLNVAPPQLKTASAVDQLLGTNFNRSRQSIFDELASVINTAYATSMNEQRDNERAYLQALANVSDNAVDTMRNQYAVDAALGANAGMQAANALSAILGMQNSSITGVNDLFGNRSTLVNQKANDLANASTDATELYNTLQQYLADFSKSLYETDSTIYTTELASWNAYIDALMSALPYLGEHDYGGGGGYYGGDYSYAPEDYYYGGSLYDGDVPTNSTADFKNLSALPFDYAGRYALSDKGMKRIIDSNKGVTRPALLQYSNPFTNNLSSVPPSSNAVGKTGKTGTAALASLAPLAALADKAVKAAKPLAVFGMGTTDDTNSTRHTNGTHVHGGGGRSRGGTHVHGGGGRSRGVVGANKTTANKTISSAKKNNVAAGAAMSAATSAKLAAQKIAQQQAAQTAQKLAAQQASAAAHKAAVAKAAQQAAAQKSTASKRTTNTVTSAKKFAITNGFKPNVATGAAAAQKVAAAKAAHASKAAQAAKPTKPTKPAKPAKPATRTPNKNTRMKK